MDRHSLYYQAAVARFPLMSSTVLTISKIRKETVFNPKCSRLGRIHWDLSQGNKLPPGFCCQPILLHDRTDRSLNTVGNLTFPINQQDLVTIKNPVYRNEQ